ncbi:MFS transporter [Amycolatopsis sp. NPDC059020]|uniref:MFS transporter n=1 Tax=unclassified Amycolatopsis TaxID=2618356 RepID=UPI00366B9909
MTLWTNRTFVLHITSATTSSLGTAASQVAVVFAVRGIGGTPADIGLVAAAGLVPALVFFLVGGVIADRWPRNLVLVGANTLSALSQGVLAVLVLTGQARLGHIVAAAAANGLATAFAMPASQGLLMRGVAKEHGPRAFATFRLGLTLAQIGGAALGGVLVAATGAGWVLAIDALTFVVAILLRLLVRVEGTFTVRGHLGRELREGWTELRSHRWLGPVIIQFAAVNTLAVGAYELVLGPVDTAETLGGAAAWGAISACDAAGMVLGGLLLMRFTSSRPLVAAVIGGVLTVSPLVAMAAAAPLTVVCAAAVAAGVGVEVFGVHLMTMLQREVRPDRLSRVSAYQSLAGFGLTPVGAALAGPLAAVAGIRGALWATSALLLLIAAVVLSLPSVRVVRADAEIVGAG